MPLKILVVDDSNFFQQRLREILNEHPQLEVIGVASNGREAVEKSASLRPDLITMDYEMPIMDGVSAVRAIMSERPVPILMFSSLTYEGARTTLDALEAGAVDFLPKNFSEISGDSTQLKRKLHRRLLDLGQASTGRNVTQETATTTPKVAPETIKNNTTPSAALRREEAAKVNAARTLPADKKGHLKGRIKLLAVGASTGGPVALAEVLTKLPGNFPLPMVLIQHMPANFTKAFAERLNRQCKIRVKEAQDGDRLEPGLALLAPGGQQMVIDKRGTTVRILPGDERVNYRPCVDVTFASAVNAFGNKTMGVIMTGMGRDGCDGARLIKQQGGCIWSQDNKSSVIYGMPMAVAQAGLTDRVLSLDEFGPALASEL